MTKPLALDLDHVGVATGDLDAGERAFRKLGFNLTARSFHRGARSPGAPIEDWGSANHCAMLQRGYVELIGLTDATKFSSVKAMLDLYLGTHIVAFEPASVQYVHDALAARNLPVDEIRNLERMAGFALHGEEQRRVAFRNMYLTRSQFTEARLQYTEHLTKDVMWQSHLLAHSNGSLNLSHIFLCAPDAAGTAHRLAPMLGIDPAWVRDGECVFRLSASELRVVTPAVWMTWAPETALPPLPAPVGLGIEVHSLTATRSYLADQGVEFREGKQNGIWIAPKDACNTVIYFFGSSR